MVEIMPGSLILRMVSDARALDWEELSNFERTLIRNDIDPWLRSIFEDAIKKVSPDEPFEDGRRGRVLFIDGPRGAGKTSFLLTLLKLWRRDREDAARTPADTQIAIPPPPEPIPELKVLRLLDFDPLPEDLPIHGWLLEPWRKLLEQPLPTADDQAGREDLLDQLSVVFERAVIGWSKVRPQGGAVQKALAYQEQASGWVDTYGKWVSFVNAVVCQYAGCHESDCRKRHRRLFVVAIDDVDLQVEQIPSLLHAIRLLRHPRVLYVLTGDYVHLRFCVELDYAARHVNLGRSRNSQGESLIDAHQSLKIQRHSDKLSSALLEKAIPDHSRCTLPYLALPDVLLFSRNGKRVEDILDRVTWNMIWAEPSVDSTAEPKPSTAEEKKATPAVNATASRTALELARPLQFVTARRAQHAVDRLDPSPNDKLTHQLNFIGDLCETSVEQAADNTYHFLLSGKLTTVHGSGLHAWRGDRLRVILSGRPELVFEPESQDRPPLPRTGAEAHGAFILQLLTETNDRISAASLQWNPDEGIIRTEVEWNTGSAAVTNVAVFHWPWLARIRASSLHELKSISDTIALRASGFGADDLDEEMLVEWFKHNILWHLAITNGKSPTVGDVRTIKTISQFTAILKELQESATGGARQDIDLWAIDLQVMTAPYWGLPAALAEKLKKSLSGGPPSWYKESRLRDAQWTVMSNAIFERNQELRPADLERFTAKFYVDRHERIDSGGEEVEMARWIPDDGRAAVRAVHEEGSRGTSPGTPKLAPLNTK
jgi:hypothetical protein